MDEARPELRIVVVDDNEWRRRGLADAVRELGGLFALEAALTTRQALDLSVSHDCDVVVLHADRTDDWDSYPAIGVAADLRRTTPQSQRLLLVAPDYSPLLPLRATEAGVTHFYRTSNLRSSSSLERALLVPDVNRTPGLAIDPGLLRSLGLARSSRLNSGLAFIDDNGLRGYLDSPHSTMTRRQSITMRHQLASLMTVKPISLGSGSVVEPKIPSWRQLSTIVHLARTSKYRDPK